MNFHVREIHNSTITMNHLGSFFLLFGLCLGILSPVSGFSISYRDPARFAPSVAYRRQSFRLRSSPNPSDDSSTTQSTEGGVVELSDDEDVLASKAAPSGPMFISQGELDPQALNPDFSDAKQTRVLIYIILSLLPVLFLIPFMLSREFIPQDMMPPVDM